MGHEEDAGGVFCEKSTDVEKMIDKLNSKCNSLSGFHMVDDFQSTKRDYSEEIRYKRFVPEKGGSGVVCLKVQPTGKCYTDGYLSVSSIGGGTQLTGANTGLRETTTTDDAADDDDDAADDDAAADAADAADDDAAVPDADDDDGATEETPVPTPSASIVLTHKHPAAGKSQNASDCVNGKTLEECRDICYNDPEECTHVWFTDNGRDNLYTTTNIPDDELNVVNNIGEYFGYPYCHSLGCGNPYQRDINCVSAVTDPSLGDGGYTNNCTTNITLSKQPMR